MSGPVRHFVGLDLGQAADFTALAVLERPLAYFPDVAAGRRPAYAVRHLQRFPPGTPYAEVVEAVRGLFRNGALRDVVLVVDQTGVGRAVVDVFLEGLAGQVTAKFVSVAITAGQTATVGHGLQVPKKELVGTLQVLLQARRLQVARTLPDAALLVKELENFKTKVTLARTDAPEVWREGPQDDLVLAVGLAAWLGEMALPLHDDSEEQTGPAWY